MTEPPRTLAFRTSPAGPHLLPAEAFPDAWRRVTAEIVAGTASELRRPISKLDDGVHEARKNLKRLRAILRLVRYSLPRDQFREGNEEMRDIGRSLSAVRDAWVLIETLAGLYDRYDDLLEDGAFATAEQLLSARHRAALQHLPEDAGSAVESVLAVGDRLLTIGPLPTTFADVGRGLGRVYRTGRRAMHAAQEVRDPAAFHEWRKSVKTLRYQLELLEPLQPALIGAQADELDRLGDLLGLDHDLVVLGNVVMTSPDSGRHDRERWLLLALAHEWRTDLKRQAFPLGAAVHAEPTKAFVHRIGGYWEAVRP